MSDDPLLFEAMLYVKGFVPKTCFETETKAT